MALIYEDSEVRDAFLYAVAEVTSARAGLPEPVPCEVSPLLARFALAELAVCALAELDRAGGDSAALIDRIVCHVVGVTHGEGAGHG